MRTSPMRNCLATMLAVTFACLVLAACQGKTNSEVPRTPVQKTASEAAGPAEGSDIFDARMGTALTALFGDVVASCAQQVPEGAADTEVKKCFNSATISALEPSGLAIRHCPDGLAVEDAVQCALAGALLMKARAQSGTGISDGAWQNLEATLDQEMAVLTIDETMACTQLGKGEGEAARICLADRVTTRFELPQEDGRACLAFTDKSEFSQCLNRAAALGIVEAAAKKSALAS